eukprot:5949645-Amphidinium_carterae.1
MNSLGSESCIKSTMWIFGHSGIVLQISYLSIHLVQVRLYGSQEGTRGDLSDHFWMPQHASAA